MIRDYKYKPVQLKKYCPVCEKVVDDAEWADFGMHLYCTEYYRSGRYLSKQNSLNTNAELHSEAISN